MRRLLPPLPAIEAFLFAARAPSFRAAAQQLALSPSAFSRRLQTLETFTGVALFERTTPPTLTAAGERYYQLVAGRLDEILSATLELRHSPSNRRLVLMSPQSLAINWLMPMVSGFTDRHPGIDVDIVVGVDLNMLRLGKADVALASVMRDCTGLATDPMVALEAAVVAPRTLAAGRPPPGSLGELPGYKLLGLEEPTDFWQRWLNRAGYHGPNLPDPTRYETWGLMYEAAANGFGLTIAVSAIANSYLRGGRLSPCFDTCVEYNSGYRIAYASKATASREDVRCLSTWLAEQMLSSRDEFRTLLARPGSDGGHADHTITGAGVQ
jgi:DNA-binding transcriptional LysR family regulator